MITSENYPSLVTDEVKKQDDEEENMRQHSQEQLKHFNIHEFPRISLSQVEPPSPLPNKATLFMSSRKMSDNKQELNDKRFLIGDLVTQGTPQSTSPLKNQKTMGAKLMHKTSFYGNLSQQTISLDASIGKSKWYQLNSVQQSQSKGDTNELPTKNIPYNLDAPLYQQGKWPSTPQKRSSGQFFQGGFSSQLKIAMKNSRESLSSSQAGPFQNMNAPSPICSSKKLLYQGNDNVLIQQSNHILSSSWSQKANKINQVFPISPSQIGKTSSLYASKTIGGNRNQWQEALKIIYVHRFKRKLKNLISYRLKPALNLGQMVMVGDLSYFQEVNTRMSKVFAKLSKLSWIMRQIASQVDKINIIQPDNSFFLLWKSFFMIVSFFSIYYFSLSASFQFQDNEGYMKPFFYALLIFSCSDSLVDLNTGYFSEGEIQRSRIQIIQRFISKDLWIHFMRIFILYYQTTTFSPNYLLSFVLCFISLYSASKDFAPLDQHHQLVSRFPVARLVALLLVVVFTIAHLSGCFFYSVSQLPTTGIASSKGKEVNCSNWITCSSLEDVDWKVQYAFALYFSFITMITVGYGDIFPVSVFEKMYVILMTCVSCAIFASTINKIGSVINELAQKQLSQKQEQYELTNYMQNRQISKQTQMKILKFIEHVQEKEKENPANGQIILKKVSKNLRHHVLVEYFGNILRQSSLFRLTFSSLFLDDLISSMKEALYSPEEIIINSPLSGEPQLIFIVDGSAGVYSTRNPLEPKLLSVVKKKEFFGMTAFFSQQKENNILLKTHETSLIVSLSLGDFIKCIHNYPNDLEKYYNIKHEIFLGGKRLEECSVCGQYTHTPQNCHLVHISLNQQLIKRKYQFSHSQLHRDPSKKRKSQKSNALLQNKTTRKHLRDIRSDFILESRTLQKAKNQYPLEYIEKENDQKFFKRVAQIKYSQNKLVTLSDLNNSDEEIDEEEEEYEDEIQDLQGEDQEFEENQEKINEDQTKFMCVTSPLIQLPLNQEIIETDEEYKIDDSVRSRCRFNKKAFTAKKKFADFEAAVDIQKQNKRISFSSTSMEVKSNHKTDKRSVLRNSTYNQKIKDNYVQASQKNMPLPELTSKMKENKDITSDETFYDHCTLENGFQFGKSLKSYKSESKSILNNHSQISIAKQKKDQEPSCSSKPRSVNTKEDNEDKNNSSISSLSSSSLSSSSSNESSQKSIPKYKITGPQHNDLLQTSKKEQISYSKIPLVKSSSIEMNSQQNNNKMKEDKELKIILNSKHNLLSTLQITLGQIKKPNGKFSSWQQCSEQENAKERSDSLQGKKKCTFITQIEKEKNSESVKNAEKIQDLIKRRSSVKKILIEENRFENNFRPQEDSYANKDKISSDELQGKNNRERSQSNQSQMEDSKRKKLSNERGQDRPSKLKHSSSLSNQQIIRFSDENCLKKMKSFQFQPQQDSPNQLKIRPTVSMKSFHSISQSNIPFSQEGRGEDYPQYRPSVDSMFLDDFDLCKEWMVFQPQNNISHVLKEIKKIMRIICIKQKICKQKGIFSLVKQFTKKKTDVVKIGGDQELRQLSLKHR